MSLALGFLRNLKFSIGDFLPPGLSDGQQGFQRASCAGFHLAEGRRGLGSGQVVTLERQREAKDKCELRGAEPEESLLGVTRPLSRIKGKSNLKKTTVLTLI